VRIWLWQHLGWFIYGAHHLLMGLTIWASLIGVVAFGSLVGSMVDVTGLVINFSVAILILSGTLL
jgi:magnesium transporter